MTHPFAHRMSLHATDGRRKYITPTERQRFIAVATHWPDRRVGVLCLLLAYAGCRISEALALVGYDVDPDQAVVYVRSLKKREKIAIREIPLPLDLAVKIRALQDGRSMADAIWHWKRGRAWQLIKIVMRAANIEAGPHATPKGLRHGFGVNAVCRNVPLPLVQRWLGHASLATTAIYTDVIGPEERQIAERMW